MPSRTNINPNILTICVFLPDIGSWDSSHRTGGGRYIYGRSRESSKMGICGVRSQIERKVSVSISRIGGRWLIWGGIYPVPSRYSRGWHSVRVPLVWKHGKRLVDGSRICSDNECRAKPSLLGVYCIKSTEQRQEMPFLLSQEKLT